MDIIADNLTPDVIRGDFPAFADDTIYTDGAIDFWLGMARLSVPGDPNAWPTTPISTNGRSILDYGRELWTCHHLAIQKMADDQAASGGAPTGPSGIINSKAVGPASVGYDTAASIEEGAGFWNSTYWGREFYHLAKLRGMGPVQLGIGIPPAGSFAAAGAWPGPWPFPTFQSGFSS